MSKVLTLDTIKSVHACPHDAAIFEQMFGGATEVRADLAPAAGPKFDWLFAAERILTPRQKKHFRALVVASSRGLSRMKDPDQSKRRTALAYAFVAAYNGPEE